MRSALLAAAEADAEAARAKLEAAEAEVEKEKAAVLAAEASKSSKRHGSDEVAAASASSSSVSPSSAQLRLKSLRRAAERTAADARFPDLPPPPPVVAFAAVSLSRVGELLSDEILGALAGVGGGGALLKPNSTTRKSGSGWSNGGVAAVGVPGPALPGMEALGQASGFVLYRASVPRASLSARPSASPASSSASGSSSASSASSASAPPHHASVLDLGTTVHDYGGVYVDGEPVAALDRASLSTSVSLPRLPALSSSSASFSSSSSRKGAKNDNGGNVTIDILVHEMGRVNFGCVTLDHKGLETDAVTLDGKRKRKRKFFFPERASKRERERERKGRGGKCSVTPEFQIPIAHRRTG